MLHTADLNDGQAAMLGNDLQLCSGGPVVAVLDQNAHALIAHFNAPRGANDGWRGGLDHVERGHCAISGCCRAVVLGSVIP
jgi:hypothetical protein